MTESLIYEKSSNGRAGMYLSEAAHLTQDDLTQWIPESLQRKKPPFLPSVSENEVVRHYVRLSLLNHGVDTGMYPLGSCTMKFNPKINEKAAREPVFLNAHPYQDEESIQGPLEIMFRLGEDLKILSGMQGITLQPAAGAHGELTGILVCRAYHTANGNPRTKILVPDSSHGTNPATAAMCGYRVVTIPSNSAGKVDIAKLKDHLDSETAVFMITNPNTLGIFEDEIDTISKLVHSRGGLMYYDGANMNAIMGYANPRIMGFDVVHFNLHKTFSTPHGTGGPGAGPVAVTDSLSPFLPYPLVHENRGRYCLDESHRKTSIGKVRSFHGNFLVLLRAFLYIRANGFSGLKRVSQHAVLNANYLKKRLSCMFETPYASETFHEFVISAAQIKKKWNVGALDIAKRIIDFGIHPPTVHFPLIVKEAIMIEPTETETRENLDMFVSVMQSIIKEAEEDPDHLYTAPHSTPVSRLNETMANRKPLIRAHSLPSARSG